MNHVWCAMMFPPYAGELLAAALDTASNSEAPITPSMPKRTCKQAKTSRTAVAYLESMSVQALKV